MEEGPGQALHTSQGWRTWNMKPEKDEALPEVQEWTPECLFTQPSGTELCVPGMVRDGGVRAAQTGRVPVDLVYGLLMTVSSRSCPVGAVLTHLRALAHAVLLAGKPCAPLPS